MITPGSVISLNPPELLVSWEFGESTGTCFVGSMSPREFSHPVAKLRVHHGSPCGLLPPTQLNDSKLKAALVKLSFSWTCGRYPPH